MSYIPSNKLTIIQHNTNCSNQVLLSLFSSFNSKNLPHVVAIQEPFLYQNSPLNVPAYSLIFPPMNKDTKVRVCFYVLKSWEATISFSHLFFDRGDFCGISFTFKKAVFSRGFTSLSLYNVYNAHIDRTTRSVNHLLAFPPSPHPSLVLGDFNIHHQLSDPLRSLSKQEMELSSPYFDSAALNGYNLLNLPGSTTSLSPDPNKRNWVIDLTFANTSLMPLVQKWANSLPATGSDHTAIATTLALPNARASAPSPEWEKTPWPLLTPFIQNFTTSPLDFPSLNPDIEIWFDRNLAALMTPITTLTPTRKPSTWSKAWWSPNISELRRIFHAVSRSHKTGAATSGQLKQAKYAYFNAIKKAKSAHWNDFTANADRNQLWAAARLMKPKNQDTLPSFPGIHSPSDLNDALIHHFFPPRPPTHTESVYYHHHTPPITAEEVAKALAKSSNKSTPGPDQIPYGVWKDIHRLNPAIIPSLLTPLVEFGIHPRSLKRANGIILPKPDKASYSDPSAFRIIVLLETISKILERIIASRLYNFASTSGLINSLQCLSLAGLSVDDAALSITHDIRTLQAAGYKISTIFLDIKGGFDNVSPSILATRLRAHYCPEYIVVWVTSFLSHRTCRLLFKGSPHIHAAVDIGVPQGSPISPLLFVIYVAPLHISIPRGVVFSYVDDFALVAASSSYRTNIIHLQAAWEAINHRAAAIKVAFSVPKTDLVHWRTERDRSPTCTLPISINGTLFHPLKEVRWLGFWFFNDLTSY